MTLKQEGYLFMLIGLIFWGAYPLLVKGGVTSVPPLFAASFVFLFAALAFAFVLTYQNKWKEIFVTEVWKYYLGAVLFIGVILYGLSFYGLQCTTAGNASIIALMEVFFTFLILGLWGKEKVTPMKAFGAALMILGALFILFPGSFQVQWGDLVILISTIFPPFGNYCMQQARKKVSSSMIMFVRSLLTGLFLLVLAYFIEPVPSIENIQPVLWMLALNGVFVLGLSKILWIEALHRIPITTAISLSTLTPVVTLILAYFFLKEMPTVWQLAGLVPMIVGVLMIER